MIRKMLAEVIDRTCFDHLTWFGLRGNTCFATMKLAKLVKGNLLQRYSNITVDLYIILVLFFLDVCIGLERVPRISQTDVDNVGKEWLRKRNDKKLAATRKEQQAAAAVNQTNPGTNP